MKKTCISCLAGLLLSSSPAISGPLTNAFEGSIKRHAEMTFSEGVELPGKETLNQVLITTKSGRKMDIESLEITTDGDTLSLNAKGITIRPKEDLLLFKIDNAKMRLSRPHLDAIASGRIPTDLCSMAGPDGSISMDNLAFILPSDEGSIDENGTFIFDRLDVSQKIIGVPGDCSADIDVSFDQFSSDFGGGMGVLIEKAVLDLTMPGSLTSISADPSRPLSISISSENAVSRISGGAMAWSIVKGRLDLSTVALSLVPIATEIIKQGDKVRDEFAYMRLWNAFSGFSGDLKFSTSQANLRSANVFPPVLVRRFGRAGLTTILFNGDLDVSSKGGVADVKMNLNVNGLANTVMESSVKLERYPEDAFDPVKAEKLFGNQYPPIKVFSFLYEHSDNGFVDAMAEILQSPLTVEIARMRADLGSTEPGQDRDMAIQLATDFASFVTTSYMSPPARINLELIPELDLRSAIIIAGKSLGEVQNMFTYRISSGK